MQLIVDRVKSASNSDPLYLQSGINEETGIRIHGSNGAIGLSGRLKVPKSKFTLWLPAAAWTPTSAGAAPATANTVSVNNDMVHKTLDFDPASDNHVTYIMPLPKGWNGTRIVPSVYYYLAGAGPSLSIVLNLELSILSRHQIMNQTNLDAVRLIYEDNEHPTRNYLSVHLATTTNSNTHMRIASLGYYQESDLSFGKEGDVEKFAALSVWRDANNGSDTAAGILKIIGVKFTYEVDDLYD